MSSRWQYVGDPSGPSYLGGSAEVLPVHAALVPMGRNTRIIYFSGSQWVEPKTWEAIDNEPNPQADPQYAVGKSEIDHCRVYDCLTQQVANPGCPDADLFCSGHALLGDGRLLIAGGTQHFPYGEVPDLHHAHWSGSRETWSFSPWREARAAIGAEVTAVWAPRQPQHLDLFIVGADGTVYSAWWEFPGVFAVAQNESGWQPWFCIPGALKVAVGATVTAVWAPRQPQHLDLFVTGTDGAVWSAWWEATSGWQPWFIVHPEIKMQPKATVTAVWRDQHLDIFVTGTDGAVWSAWWEPPPNWQPWFLVSPGIKAAIGATVTAVWAPRQPQHLDLFITGTDGAVWSACWEAPGPFDPNQNGWGEWFIIRQGTDMQPGATVTAVWRDQHLDLFVTGTDGAVWSAWWELVPNWQPWFLVSPETKAAIGATVTAVWAPRQPQHLDLFITGTDGAVWSAWWEAPGPFDLNQNGWREWFIVRPEIKMQPKATLTALWRDQHLDLFVTGTDGAVWSAWWEPVPKWQPWFLILSAAPWIEQGLLNRDPGQDNFGGGRWYPTLITLPSGQVMALCGHPLIGTLTTPSDYDIRHNNTKPELFDPATAVWTLVTTQLGVDQAHDYAPYYPRMHIVPHTGEVFIVQPLYSRLVIPWTPSEQCYNPDPGKDLCSENPLDTSPSYGQAVMDASLFYDVANATVTRAFPGPQIADPLYLDQLYTSQQTTSVMLPLLHEENCHPRVMICGAAQPLIADLQPPNDATPEWAPTAPRQLGGAPPRSYATAILLPTGDVLVSGGVLTEAYAEADGVRTAEIYHPPLLGSADSWEVGPVAGETRGYHSVALLMPDGRVWTAGSESTGNPMDAKPNLSIEVFEPDYYQNPNRLILTRAPSDIAYGEPFMVEFSGGFSIMRVALMRFGSATHAFDGDQRFVGIPFAQSGSALTATASPDSTIAPPGFYMLWLIDSNNQPCKVAPFVRLHQ